jgi:hypothetical protein
MSKVRDSVEDLRIIDDKAPIDNPSFTGPVTATGDTTIGAATAATNVQLILNGVASKAQRIKFAESGVDKWFIGQGAASETDAFEIYNSNGQMSLSIAKATSNASFSGSLIASGGVYLGGTVAANKLDDFESGTWNPSENNGVTLTDNETPRYTKVGDMVHLWFDVTVATNTNGNSFDLSGIPFTANDIGCAGGAVYYCNMNNSLANAGLSFHFGTTTRAALRSGYDATVDLADMSGHRISGVLIYKATA